MEARHRPESRFCHVPDHGPTHQPTLLRRKTQPEGECDDSAGARSGDKVEVSPTREPVFFSHCARNEAVKRPFRPPPSNDRI